MVHQVIKDVSNWCGNKDPFVYRQITPGAAIQDPVWSSGLSILDAHFENIGAKGRASKTARIEQMRSPRTLNHSQIRAEPMTVFVSIV